MEEKRDDSDSNESKEENEKNSDEKEKDFDEETENAVPAFAQLRALERALSNRVSVRTSRVELRHKTSSSWKFIDIDGKLDANSLSVLEESISDIICLDDKNNNESSARTIKAQSSCELASVIADENTNKSSVSSAILDDESPASSRNDSRARESFYSLPSCSSSFGEPVEPEALRQAEAAISDLENQGQAGLLHLSSLSASIGRPIRIWSSSMKMTKNKVGRSSDGEPVDVEYHAPAPDAPGGHWTLRGNSDPDGDVQGGLNDCLFNVVADQTGELAPELRSRTISRMRKNVKALARRITAIAEQENCESISLLVGGARYIGERPQDAREVLDASQQGRCHPRGLYGHPRGHASHPGAQGQTESVENYSHTGWKSGFLSREDQDAVAHLVLETSEAQDAMKQLNRGSDNIALRLSPRQLRPGPLPEGAIFERGERGPDRSIKQLVMVLRHHQGEQNNPEANVFVQTFYPVLD